MFTLTMLVCLSINAQKKPVIIEKIDEFEGYRSIKAEKKVLGVVQLYVEAMLIENDTVYRVHTSIINTGSIIDNSQPYFVILENNNKYKLKILNTSTPVSNGYGAFTTSILFQIPNELVPEFMESAIKKGRIYYITDTYDEVTGGVVTTALTTYLTAVYNRVHGMD